MFSWQQDSGHKLREENRIKGRGRDLAFWLHPHPHPFPTQNLGSLEREVCTMSPGGGARAAVVFHPHPPAPTPVCPGHRLQLQAPGPGLLLFELLPHAGRWSTPEVAAPAPERADLEDRNSFGGGGPGHPDSAEEMIPWSVVTLVPGRSWCFYCVVSDSIRGQTERWMEGAGTSWPDYRPGTSR